MYKFSESVKEGEKHELALDEFFSQWYSVIPVSMDVQRMGIDRIFVDDNGRRTSVEYKADTTACSTGNAFIETMSCDRDNVKGWALTSTAQMLVYYLPKLQIARVINTQKLKDRVPYWVNRYKKHVIPNKGYNGEGYAVPLQQLDVCTVKTLQVTTP